MLRSPFNCAELRLEEYMLSADVPSGKKQSDLFNAVALKRSKVRLSAGVVRCFRKVRHVWDYHIELNKPLSVYFRTNLHNRVRSYV